MIKKDNSNYLPEDMPFAAYPGSTIQQNYGESLEGHGFLMWDLQDKSIEAVDVPNEHSYHTVKIESGVDYDDLNIELSGTKYTHIKVQWIDYLSQLSRENQSKITRHLKERYKPVELSFRKTAVKLNDSGYIVELSPERLADISSESNQKDIFVEYLRNYQYPDNDIEAILKIHESVTERLKENGYQDSKGYEYKLESLWIDNFKSYGDRVEIDWVGMDGVWQITGENTAGKSTILDAITYLFYGTMLGAMTAEKNGENRFINNIRDLNHCEVGAYLNVNNILHKLVRRTERTWQNSKGERTIKSVSTSVYFYEVLGFDGKGNELLKDIGIDRKVQTDKLLQEYFGTIQDFMRSAFINADTLTSLLSITHSVFVDSLLRDIGLDIFEKLLKEFKSWRDETYAKTKRISITPSVEEDKIHAFKRDISAALERIDDAENQLELIEERIAKGSEYIKEKYALIQHVRPDLEEADSDELRTDIHNLIKRISDFNQEMKLEQERLDEMRTSYTREEHDELLEAKEASQKVISDIRGKVRDEESKQQNAQHGIALVQGKIKLRERDIEGLAEKFAQYRRVTEKEILVAETEVKNLENSKTCPTCKRLKNDEAISAIQEVIEEKQKAIDLLHVTLEAYPQQRVLAEQQILLDIDNIEDEKSPFFILIKQSDENIKVLSSDLENHVLAVDEISQKLVSILNQRAIWEKKQRREAELKQIPLRIENLELQKEAKVRLLEDLEKAQDIIHANHQVLALVDKAQEKLTVLRQEKEELVSQKNLTLKGYIPSRESAIKDTQQLLDSYRIQEHQDNLLKAYEKCIHRDGIPTVLLKQYLSVINIQIANLLDNMKFTLFLNEQLQFKIYNHNREDAVMNVLQASGMQKTFASLVLRLALRQVNNKYRSNLLLMDEILGKLDPNHLERFTELISRAKEQIDKLVIIEHGYGDTINPDYVIQVTTDKQGVSTLSY